MDEPSEPRSAAIYVSRRLPPLRRCPPRRDGAPSSPAGNLELASSLTVSPTSNASGLPLRSAFARQPPGAPDAITSPLGARGRSSMYAWCRWRRAPPVGRSGRPGTAVATVGPRQAAGRSVGRALRSSRRRRRLPRARSATVPEPPLRVQHDGRSLATLRMDRQAIRAAHIEAGDLPGGPYHDGRRQARSTGPLATISAQRVAPAPPKSLREARP